MKNVSFGKLSVLLEQNDAPYIEHLIFDKSGRGHQHEEEFEYFYVIKGEGVVCRGEEELAVSAGDLIIIPPKTVHHMYPNPGEVMEAFLWYDKRSLILR